MTNLGEKFIKGDCIPITSTLTDPADNVTISVQDSDGVIQVSAASMTEESSNIWTYNIHTTDAWSTGKVTIQTIANPGACQNVEEDYLTLNAKSFIV
ncbi:hypothetical protein KAR91_61505 [Candidatus Pacearchaeota archaeon]|nr:hypothetical protein [Candidatus Pacearchaeota archaeon]